MDPKLKGTWEAREKLVEVARDGGSCPVLLSQEVWNDALGPAPVTSKPGDSDGGGSRPTRGEKHIETSKRAFGKGGQGSEVAKGGTCQRGCRGALSGRESYQPRRGPCSRWGIHPPKTAFLRATPVPTRLSTAVNHLLAGLRRSQGRRRESRHRRKQSCVNYQCISMMPR